MEEAEEDCRDRQTLGTYLVWKIARKAANFMNGIWLYILFICFMFSNRTHIFRTWCNRFDSSFTQYRVKISRSTKLNYQKSKDGFVFSFYLVSEG
jgi:hypothetical protein